MQGTGADGLKIALTLLYERRDECPSAVPILAVHDEIVVECDEEDGEHKPKDGRELPDKEVAPPSERTLPLE